MKYAFYDLGMLARGDVVVVSLSGDSVNVRLMDAANYGAFQRGRQHRYVGGHVTRSPYRVTVPSDGHWYVTIDRGGYAVNVRHSVSVERAAGRILPPAELAPHSAMDVARNFRNAHLDAEAEVAHDVFLSHASEDKDEIVRPLFELLEARGLSVWLDEVKMKVGASLRRSIDQALATSRYAVVILSPSFFAKNWTQYELDGLVAREMNGEQIILPIWHRITKTELLQISPPLADKFALTTATLTLDEIADQVADAIRAASE